MTTTPEAIAAQVRDTIYRAGAETPRAQQSADRILGMSDIGQCRSMLARMIDGHPRHPRQDDIKLAAFIGTAVGDLLEAHYPTSQVPTTVTLPGGLKVRGTADIVTPDSVIDIKTSGDIDYVRHNGPPFENLAQIAGYLVGLVQDQTFNPPFDPDNPEPVGALVYLDRTGKDENPHVHTITISQAHDILDEVQARLDDVTYAIAHGIDENAPRDKPRPWCEAACPWVGECRGEAPTDVEGIIDDPETLTAVETYTTAKAAEKDAAKLAAQAKTHLEGIQGSTGTHVVYWTEIGESIIPETRRKASRRLNVRPIRGQ